MKARDLAGKRITVMGLGLLGGGVGVTRFLARQGADVTVTDLKDAETLAESVAKLDGLPVAFRLGGHVDADFTNADLVVVNPAVPDGSPFLAKARAAGVALETEINLFVKLCPATLIGVTGSNGKSTTVSLLHHLLAAGDRRAWLGGNIGRSLLEDLAAIGPDDLVVLELSSFQLGRLRATRRSPAISVVLNLSPNHLDRHGTVEAYAHAKQAILANQRPTDFALLNADCPAVSAWETVGRGSALYFSTSRAIGQAAYVDRGHAVWRHNGRDRALFRISDLTLVGRRNLSNALAASLAAALCGVEPAAIAARVGTFTSLEHRLEPVRELAGVRYYNDSKATTPEAAMAALDAFEQPVVLIAGGYDKHLPFDALGGRIAARARHVVLLGETAEQIQQAIAAHGATPTQIVPDLEAAVRAARAAAHHGDVVLLSPACASYDMFDNFEQRGARFKRLVEEMEP